LAVAIIMIDGSEKPNRQLGFELQSSHVIENRNKNRSKLLAQEEPMFMVSKEFITVVGLATNKITIILKEI